MSASAREATDDYSRGSRASRRGERRLAAARFALLAAAGIAAVLLVVSEFSPLYKVMIGHVERGRELGRENHAYAMLLLAVAVVPMVIGAARSGARPAHVAL